MVTLYIYMKDSIDNSNFLFNYFLTCDSEKISVLQRKAYFWQYASYNNKLKSMLIKELTLFHSRNSLNVNDSVFWSLSVNSFQTKCLMLPDNAFQTKF